MTDTTTDPATPTAPRAGRRVACGVDVVAVDRIDALLEEFGEPVRSRLFTDEEVGYCRSRVASAQHFAARWAAKEATMKALPPLDRSVAFADIGVEHDPHGRPRLRFADWIDDRLRDGTAFALSLSHDRRSGTAMAQVIRLSPTAPEGETT